MNTAKNTNCRLYVLNGGLCTFNDLEMLAEAKSDIYKNIKERIQEIVCKTYGITKEELLKSKRGTFNEPRGVAIYLSRMIRSEGLMDICKDYNLKKYSSASSIVNTVKGKLSKDRKFHKRVNDLSKTLIKGQPETP